MGRIGLTGENEREATARKKKLRTVLEAMLIEFAGNDEEYFVWLSANPNGFVLHTRSRDDPLYTVLHRSSCGTISSIKRHASAGRLHAAWAAPPMLTDRPRHREEALQQSWRRSGNHMEAYFGSV